MALWTTPTTHASGDTLAVTDWNAVANNETFLYEAPYASYYNSVATSLINTTFTQITLGGTDYSGYGFSVSSNNVVAPIAGMYWVGGGSSSNPGDGMQTGPAIYYGGAVVKQTIITTGSATSTGAFTGALVQSVASGLIALYAYNGSGAPTNTVTGTQFTYLHVFFIGST